VVHRVVGGEEAIPAQSATARPRPSASALPGGEQCLSYRRITGTGPAWCGINRVPDVGFISGVPLRSEAMVVLDKPE
jgi:hypothetical protein